MLLPSLYSFVRSNYDIRDEKAWLYVRIRVSIEEKEESFFHIPGGTPGPKNLIVRFLKFDMCTMIRDRTWLDSNEKILKQMGARKSPNPPTSF